MSLVIHTQHEPPRRSLALRILDCFSAGKYVWHMLLRILDVVETTEVETAAVECRLQPRLLINPEFVERHAETSEKLLMLVMHELHHVLLGHTRLFPRVTPLDNLVFDAVINALLCKMFPEEAYVRFFSDYYREDRFPECFLRPAPGWKPQVLIPQSGIPRMGWKFTQNLTLPSVLAEAKDPEICETHRALYSAVGVGYEELYRVLGKCIPAEQAADVRLLGDHRPENTAASSSGALEQRSPLLLESVREIVERWPLPPSPIRGRSWDSLVRKVEIKPRREPSNRERLRRLIQQTAGVDGADGSLPRIEDDSCEILTPLPKLDRRTTVLTALGRKPLWYPGQVPMRRVCRRSARVHVYVDVSGSLADLRKVLYGAVLDCRELVHPAIHLFSTQVKDVSLAALRQGVCPTTNGTDIHCVAEHIRRHRVRRAVLLTDGFVGPPQGGHEKLLKTITLGVALIGDNVLRSDLEAVTNHWTELKGA